MRFRRGRVLTSTVPVALAGALMLWLIVAGRREASPSQTTSEDVTATESWDHEPLLTREQEAGRLPFERYCAFCHGREGDGAGINAPNLPVAVPDLADATLTATRSAAQLSAHVSGEDRPAGQPPICPPWRGRLSAREIDAVAAYVEALLNARRRLTGDRLQ